MQTPLPMPPRSSAALSPSHGIVCRAERVAPPSVAVEAEVKAAACGRHALY
jgi:hypothetical protein